MKIRIPTGLAVAAAFFLSISAARATIYATIDAESSSVNSSTWALSDGGATYNAVIKGAPDIPWISPSQHYAGVHSLGFRLEPTDGSQGSTDKITYPLVLGSASHAMPANGGSGYTGYAVWFPTTAAQFQTPTDKLLCFQWWQGAPYGPPLRMELTTSNSTTVTYRFWVLNNDTLGNPSAVPIDIGGGTVTRGSWAAFVVYTHWDFNGNGECTVWQAGTRILDWVGKLGYDPSTIPYKNPPAGTANPNQKLQIEFGLYRPFQNVEHTALFDNVKFADSYNDASP